jgi:SAM-dependent methyltransferase
MELQERTIPGLHAALLPRVKSLRLAGDAKILDLACGTGAWLTRLHTAGFRRLWGTDQDVDAFQARGIAQFIPADLDAGPEFGNDFLLVTMIEIIEHVANPYRLVEIAAKALAPGGWLLITSPNIYSLRARLRFLARQSIPQFERSSRASLSEDHIHPVILEAYRRKVFEPLQLTLEELWTYPEKGSCGAGVFARIVSKAFGLILPDNLPGDVLCLLVRKPGDRRSLVKPEQTPGTPSSSLWNNDHRA